MNIDDDLTTDRLIDLYETTRPALAALFTGVEPHADKRPADPARNP